MNEWLEYIIGTILFGILVAAVFCAFFLLSVKVADPFSVDPAIYLNRDERQLPTQKLRSGDRYVDTSKAVIHHTFSPCWTTVRDIDKWHRERGWDGIGYHFVIKCNGEIERGRSINKQGAHAKGRNNRIGIAIVGYDLFTDRQLSSLKALLSRIGVSHIEEHHKDCPGPGIDLANL